MTSGSVDEANLHVCNGHKFTEVSLRKVAFLQPPIQVVCPTPCWGKPGHVKDTGHIDPGDMLVETYNVAAEVGGPLVWAHTLIAYATTLGVRILGVHIAAGYGITLGVIFVGVHRCASCDHLWVSFSQRCNTNDGLLIGVGFLQEQQALGGDWTMTSPRCGPRSLRSSRAWCYLKRRQGVHASCWSSSRRTSSFERSSPVSLTLMTLITLGCSSSHSLFIMDFGKR